MAKKRLNQIKKKPTMKECWVKLKRLNPSEIESYLKPNDITHNIDAKIEGCTLRMGKATITSKNLVFDVHMKLHEGGITISKRKSSTLSSNPNTSKNSTQKSNQKSNLTIAVLQPKPITKLIDLAWQRSKLNRSECHLNDVVMAKVKGHVAWPAILIGFVNKSKAKVEFLGANQNEKFGFISLKEMVHYSECNDVIRLTLKRTFIYKEKFEKGIREAEILFGIPSHASMLND